MAESLLDLVRLYLFAGAAVAAVFCGFLVGRIDQNGDNAWIFRPLLIPGAILLWPVVLARLFALRGGWQEARRHHPPRNSQDRIAIALVVLIPVILAVCLSARQPNKYEAPAIRLAPPSGETNQ